MKETPWYKKLFCGYNIIGALAEKLCYKTEIDIPLEIPVPAVGKRKAFVITHNYRTKCWCCTFWRGIFIGLSFGIIIGLLLARFI